MRLFCKTTSCGGFAMVEMSIVIVLVGLAIGGVVVATSMMYSAKIRSTIAQIESFNAAVGTFQTRYHALPGDIPSAAAAGYGLFQINCASGCPNLGNGRIDSSGVREDYVFWRHLSESALVDESYGTDPAHAIDAATGAATASSNYFLPILKTGDYYFAVRGGTPLCANTADTLCQYGTAYTIADQNGNAQTNIKTAVTIDSKIDDGMPNTGMTYIDGTTLATSWSRAATSGKCLYNGNSHYAADVKYNTDSEHYAETDASGNVCGLFIKANF